MRERDYEDWDCSLRDAHLEAAAHCRGFCRRCDVSSFNMTDYRSCENCGHLTADSRCALQMQNRLYNTRD